jgi:hypothetical protein
MRTIARKRNSIKPAHFPPSSCPAIAVRRTAFLQNAYVPGIHVFAQIAAKKTWMAGTKRAFTPVFDGRCPAMTRFFGPAVLLLVALLAQAHVTQVHAAGECRFKKSPPVTLKDMGPCGFDPDTLSFKGDAAQQAKCLLTPLREGGKLTAPLDKLPDILAERVGTAEGLPERDALRALLSARGLADTFGDSLTTPVSRAEDGALSAKSAGYIVLHDTSAPNFRKGAWPADIDNDPKINNLRRYACSNKIERAHVFINRGGAIFHPHDFETPWRATKFEMATNFDGRLKGLFLHVELVQPRKRHPKFRGDNDYLAPQPGFTPEQYDALALTYIVASLRAGQWLIPAYHAVLDEGIPDKHDDPQNFDLAAFAQSLTRLLDALQPPD